MSEQNPVILGLTLESTLRRYLKSALPISQRYPILRQAINTCLEQGELLLKETLI